MVTLFLKHYQDLQICLFFFFFFSVNTLASFSKHFYERKLGKLPLHLPASTSQHWHIRNLLKKNNSNVFSLHYRDKSRRSIGFQQFSFKNINLDTDITIAFSFSTSKTIDWHQKNPYVEHRVKFLPIKWHFRPLSTPFDENYVYKHVLHFHSVY